MWATDLLSRHRIASALALALHATAATAAGPDITEADLDTLVEGAAKVTRLLDNNPRPMNKADIRAIYTQLI